MRSKDQLLFNMTKTSKKTKESALFQGKIGSAIREILDKYGEGSIMKLGEARHVDVDVIPTGSISLDIALGVGGIPKGRIVEIYGGESSGKTTMALHLVSNVQKKGHIASYIDAEHALDPEYAKKIGVNTEDLLISQPDSGEEALDIAETLVKSGAVDLIVVDSVAALTPQAELEARMDEQQMGLQARLMSKALRKLTALSSQTGTTIVFINQTRMKIGIMFGNPTTTPGGMALKFFSSVRISLDRIAKIQKGDKIIGNRIKAKVVKNKVAPPFREAEFDILFNKGINKEGDAIKTGEKLGVIARSGNTYKYGDKTLGSSFDAARDTLSKDQKLFEEIIEKIKKISIETQE